MTRISHDATLRVGENRRCILKRDSELGEICRSFPRVLLELQYEFSLYLPYEDPGARHGPPLNPARACCARVPVGTMLNEDQEDIL